MTRRLAVAATVLTLLACGAPAASAPANNASGSRTPMASSSPSSSGTPDPTAHLPPSGADLPATAATCGRDPGDTDPLAVVSLHGQAAPVLRDYADEAHPFNVCSFSTDFQVTEILDAHHIAATYGPNPVVIVIPSGQVWPIAVESSEYGIAPDLSQILWLSTDSQSLHDSWDRQDVVLQQYPGVAGRCGSAAIDSKTIAFSRDAKYAFALWHENSPSGTYLNVVGNHQSIFALAPPANGWGAAGGPLMAVWSPVSDTLYFTKLGGVWTWTPSGGATAFHNSLTWIDPTLSPDGRQIAYATSPGGNPSVRLMDASSAVAGTTIPRALTPFFLTNDLLWVLVWSGGCAGASQVPYIYDRRDHTLTRSVIDWVIATWPATSALAG